MPPKSPTPAQVLSQIHAQRKNAPLSILGLAEPILSPATNPTPQTPSSADSAQPPNALSPSSLSADLAHYRDLFSKLRFSYLEQVTKEKYLRGIVGEPPILATAEQNAELEEKLGVMKSELQAKKREVEALVAQIEGLAREIAERYDAVEGGVRVLEVVPGEIEVLEGDVERVRAEVVELEGEREVDADPRMNLGVEATRRLLEEQRRKRDELDRRIEEMEQDLPGVTRECEEAEKELEQLERRRNEITKAARDMQRLKEKGGRDMLEEQGRWYQSSEVVLKGLLGVES